MLWDTRSRKLKLLGSRSALLRAASSIRSLSLGSGARGEGWFQTEVGVWTMVYGEGQERTAFPAVECHTERQLSEHAQLIVVMRSPLSLPAHLNRSLSSL
jgi:hypothetical protein